MNLAHSCESALHSIFGFRHQAPSSLQQHHPVLELVLKFIKHITQTQKYLPKDGGKALKFVKEVLAGDGLVKWETEYGCAIIINPPEVKSEGITRTLRIIALDKWVTETHAFATGEPLSSERKLASVSKGYQLIFETSVAESSYVNLWELYQTALSEQTTPTATKKRESESLSQNLFEQY
jgi:hypothetical protein